MLVADLNLSSVFKNLEEEQISSLVRYRMGKKGEECVPSVQDVEEGEISDSASVEEITADDLVKQTPLSLPAPESAAVAAAAKVSNYPTDPKQKVWTMQDLLKYQNKYQISRNYGPGLYNFAWAQAVQNKPLDDYLSMEFNNNNTTAENNGSSNSNLKHSASSNDIKSSVAVKKETDEVNDHKIIIDVIGDEADDEKNMVGDEKEEGELEEGEIDFDIDMDVVEKVKAEEEEGFENNAEDGVRDDNSGQRVKLIRQGFESVTVNDAEKCYDGVCSRLLKLLDSLWKVELENSVSVPKKDDLVQLSLSSLRIVNSVFCSMSQNQKEQNRDILSRLLAQVGSQKPPLFSPDQMKEVEAMIPSSDSYAVPLRIEDCDKERDIQVTARVNPNDSDASPENTTKSLIASEECVLETKSIESLNEKDPNLWEFSKIETPSSKSRVLLPLLNLHMDHDADSLPSPTRQMPSNGPFDKSLFVGDGVIRPEWPAPRKDLEMPNNARRRYETDALKAVSTYQQKFGRSSFNMNDRLPSPTPSVESDDACGDTGGEVSSSSTFQNVNSVNEVILARPTILAMSHVDVASMQSLVHARNAAPVSSTSSFVTRVPTKSRDPRLRFANSDADLLDLNQRTLPQLNNQPIVEPLETILGSRKQKAFDEPVLVDDPAPKRQRTEFTDSGIPRDVQAVSQGSGWLEDRGTVGLQVANRNHDPENRRSDPRNVENAILTSGIANGMPTPMVSGSERNPITGVNLSTTSLQSLLKDIAVNPAMWMNIIKMEQQKSVDPTKYTSQPQSSNSIAGALPTITSAPPNTSMVGQQMPQTPSVDDSGKIRMKPRDPRRALHLQKGGNSGTDQSNNNLLSVQGTKGNLKHDDLLDKKSIPSQPVRPPDIARQFTKNLKNIADIMSVSQANTNVVAPQVSSSRPAQVHPSFVNIKGVLSDSGHLQSGTNQTSEEIASGPPQSQNAWGDVEHLFDGYDDQQKAAIQRERARRIEEQKKMFAVRKLCLVLDLDHTLLNSAKFVEIEPLHDEMLRNKEEQDREKPQKHLFRFPHMGMWTKLRPGIWNFLEKASKLYELHLYTMGNKMYATEMAKLLDPKGVLFNGRVISKGDDGDVTDGEERAPKSKDLEGVLGMESAVVIIDDSIRVWPHNKLNLIVVERYIYFPCSRRQFGLPGPSLLEIDHDERPEDGTLASSLAVIERIHQNFFLQQSLDDADVRNILASEQRKILGGCRIVFSRVFPVGEANPHLHPLWQTAEQFGALCTNQIDEQVTHVVANSLGTDKVNWALSTGRFVVHPGWVEASALLYRRANEQDFAVKP